MPGSDENVIVLESDDDDEALSGDKDDVVFVNITPPRLQPAKIKSYLTPISIDSDDEDQEHDDDDIIFVSATRGRKEKASSRRLTLSTPSLPVVTSQDDVVLSTLEQSLNASGTLNPPQSLPQDVLTSSEHEHNNPLLITPKLPPGQPNFHDTTNYSETDGNDVTGGLAAVTTQNDVVDPSSRLSTVDPPGSLSAFLADVKPQGDPMVSGSAPNVPWSDPSSAQQGLLAWLRDLSTPSVGLNTSDSTKTDNNNTSDHGNVAGSTNPVANTKNSSPDSSSSNPLPSSSLLSSIQTIDNLLSSTSTLPTSSTASAGVTTGSYDNTSSSAGPQSANITSLASSIISPSSLYKAFQAVPGVCPPATPEMGGVAGSNINSGPFSSSSPISITSSPTSSLSTSLSSVSTTPTSSTTSPTSVQSSGATSPALSIPVRISTRHASPPPKPPPALSSLSASIPSSPSLGPGVASTPTQPQQGAGQARARSPASSVALIAQSLRASRSDSKTVSGDTGSSSAAPLPKAPLLKRSASYMQTHPNNIPLKKRRRQRAGQRLSLDSADSRAGGGSGDTDSRKCSWCQLMVSYSHLSLCMQGHPCCADCLQHRAKALLSKSKRGSLKCPYPSCVSYFPMSQLQRTLPPMVVEILEEKLDQEYINYAADLVWQNLGESSGGGGNSGGPDGDGAAMADDEDEDDDDEDGSGVLVGGDRGHGAGLTNKQPTLCPLPVFWEPMEDNSGYKLVELSTENIEYTEICCLFNSTMKNQATIQRILRIQNPILWQFYNVKKLQMGQESGGEPVTEKQLCHGTSNSVVDAICKSNFDWRLCGAHGTMYGQGTYFARDSSYSHVYTDNARPRTLHSPGHILAMLNKSKRARNQICLKHLQPLGVTGSGGGSSSGSSGSSSMWSGAMLTPQPPPAHWKPTVSVSVILPSLAVQTVNTHTQTAMPGGGTTSSTPAALTVVTPTSSSSSSSSSQSQSQRQSVTMTVNPAASSAGPTIGSTSTGNSGLNLSMRPTSMSHSALYKAFSQQHHHHAHHHSLSRYMQPPPAHQSRRPVSSSQVGSSSAGTCSAHGRSSSHYSKRRPSSSSYSNDTSANAASQPKRPVHSMFIAKVLVGKYTNGHNHYRKPPPVDLSDPYGRAYDSCVDNVHDPKIYVIFDSAQCYPEYLIEYTGNTNSCYI